MRNLFRIPILLVLVTLSAGVVAGLLWNQQRKQGPAVLAAASAGSGPAAQFLKASDGGMAQYGYAMQQSGSLTQTLQALAEWNSYTTYRAEWGMSTPLVERLAVADWNARQIGPPTVSAEQLASAATNLINAHLATMTAQEQEDGFEQMIGEVTPKGSYLLNPGVEHVSAAQNPDGTWRATVFAQAFSEQKAEFAALAPGMVSDGPNFYPGEAIMIAYSVASEDDGFGGEFPSIAKEWIGKLTGLDMASRSLYGENGYSPRRPLTTFLTEPRMSQFFSELGF